MPVSTEEVRRIAKLARLRLTSAEEVAMADDLSSILNYVEQLNALDIKGVEPMSHVLDLVNATREDVATNRTSREEALRSAPSADSDYFRVPRVIE